MLKNQDEIHSYDDDITSPCLKNRDFMYTNLICKYMYHVFTILHLNINMEHKLVYNIAVV